MKKINVAISIFILITWRCIDVLLHVSFNSLTEYMNYRLSNIIYPETLVYFEIAIWLLGFIAIFTAIWLCFEDDIIELYNRLKKVKQDEHFRTTA